MMRDMYCIQCGSRLEVIENEVIVEFRRGSSVGQKFADLWECPYCKYRIVVCANEYLHPKNHRKPDFVIGG